MNISTVRTPAELLHSYSCSLRDDERDKHPDYQNYPSFDNACGILHRENY